MSPYDKGPYENNLSVVYGSQGETKSDIFYLTSIAQLDQLKYCYSCYSIIIILLKKWSHTYEMWENCILSFISRADYIRIR